MAKPQEYSVLDGEFDINLNVPSTYEEFDTALGETGAALAEGTDNIIYRNTLPRLYRGVSEQLEQLGHKRAVTGTKTLADKTEKEIKENVGDHIKRVLKEGTITKEDLGSLFVSVAAALPFYKEGERSGFGGKVSQAALDGANNILAQGEARVAAVVAHIESTVPAYKVGRDADGNVTPESLARAIQALTKHMEREAKKASAQALGL